VPGAASRFGGGSGGRGTAEARAIAAAGCGAAVRVLIRCTGHLHDSGGGLTTTGRSPPARTRSRHGELSGGAARSTSRHQPRQLGRTASGWRRAAHWQRGWSDATVSPATSPQPRAPRSQRFDTATRTPIAGLPIGAASHQAGTHAIKAGARSSRLRLAEAAGFAVIDAARLGRLA
jgi:hypothetical protein